MGYHCQFVLSVERAEEKADEALRILPRFLKVQVVMETRAPKVTWHGFFRACLQMSRRFFERFLCDKLVQMVCESDELIFASGEAATNAFFTDMGNVHYSATSNVLRSLRDTTKRSGSGSLDFFKLAQEDRGVEHGSARGVSITAGRCVAEPGLWCKWVHSGVLRSETHTTLLAANVLEFTSLAKFYPCIEYVAIRYANTFVLMGRRQSQKVSDMFDFKEMAKVAGKPARTPSKPDGTSGTFLRSCSNLSDGGDWLQTEVRGEYAGGDGNGGEDKDVETESAEGHWY